MKTENTLTLTVKRTFAPIPSETEKELDRLCELYGQTLQRFQQSFCTRELRHRVWDWRDFRTIMTASFNTDLADRPAEVASKVCR